MIPPAGASVTLIVVNYNGGDELARRLALLLESVTVLPNAEMIVVDNASTDGSRATVSDFCRRRSATAILNDENAGYGAAINRAAAASRSDYIAICNMDVIVDPEWLPPLVEWLRAHPSAGGVNPLLLLADGRHANAFGQSIHVTGLGFNRNLGTPLEELPTTASPVIGLQGAALALRRQAFDEVGGMPEDGFLYHEDVHLSLRLRLAGYELHCIPQSRVRHDYALSMYAAKFHLLERNRLLTLLTCFHRTTLLAIAPLLLLTEMLAWGFSVMRGPEFLRAKWRGYRDVIGRRNAIRAAHLAAEKSRKVSDFSILRTLSWRYEWRQFATLARERGKARATQAIPS